MKIEDLIGKLEGKFPDRLPNTPEPHDRFILKVGHQEVIRYAKALLQQEVDQDERTPNELHDEEYALGEVELSPYDKLMNGDI